MCVADVLAQFLGQLVDGAKPGRRMHEGVDGLPFDLVRQADGRRLGHGRVADQRDLDLGRAQPVAGDLDHVVHAADDPEVAVLVALGRVAGHVHAGVLAPVLAARSVGVAVDRAQHGRPGFLSTR